MTLRLIPTSTLIMTTNMLHSDSNPHPASKVRITPGHNIQGAKQPAFMHIGATKSTKHKGRVRAPAVGVGVVMRREQTHWLLTIEGEGMRLGIWWLDAAMRGAVDVLPIVNAKPRFEKASQ